MSYGKLTGKIGPMTSSDLRLVKLFILKIIISPSRISSLLLLSNERALRDWRETNHGFQGLAQPSALGMREEDCKNAARRARERERASQMLPASWDWQKKIKNRSSLLAEFLFLPCPIRAANTSRAPLFISVFIRVI